MKKLILPAALLALFVATAASTAETTTAPSTAPAATQTPQPAEQTTPAATDAAGGAGAALLGLLKSQGIVTEQTAETLSPHLQLLEKQLGESGDAAGGTMSQLLNSPRAKQLRELLAGAVGGEKTDSLSFSDRLAETMQLSKDQLTRLRPAMDQGMTDLRAAAGKALAEGKTSWTEFKPDYDAVMTKMRSTMKEGLSAGQLQKFDAFLKTGGEQISRLVGGSEQ